MEHNDQAELGIKDQTHIEDVEKLKSFTIRTMPEKLHRKLKIFAGIHSITMEEIVITAIDAYITRELNRSKAQFKQEVEAQAEHAKNSGEVTG